MKRNDIVQLDTRHPLIRRGTYQESDLWVVLDVTPDDELYVERISTKNSKVHVNMYVTKKFVHETGLSRENRPEDVRREDSESGSARVSRGGTSSLSKYPVEVAFPGNAKGGVESQQPKGTGVLSEVERQALRKRFLS